ncbi:serine/threonine protein kinase [Pseudanabaena sp. lw0831]|nr:serine/threonine protein kinase [Pseudanabaena sp. lw0831]
MPAIAQSSVLQTALAGLDASLNDELDRYRHWQDNGQTISYLNPFRPRAVSTQSIWTSPSLSDALSPIAPIADPTTSDRRTIQMPVMPPMGTGLLANPSINISAAELHNFKGLETLHSLESLNGTGFEQDLPYAQDMNGYGEASGLTSPTMARAPEPDDDDILQSFANDYADSSQENVEEESAYPIPNAPNEKSALRSLMNPVGIISLLLLLCSSAAIGYLMVDPSGVMKLFKPESRPKSAQNDVKNSDLGSDINLQNQQQKANDTGLSFVPFAGDKSALSNSNKSLTNPAVSTKNPLTKPSTKASSLFAPNSAFVPNTTLRTVPSTALPPISVAPLPAALAPAPAERSYNAAPSRNYDSAPAPSYNPPAPRPTTSKVNSSPSTAKSTSTNTSRNDTNPAPTTVYVTPRSNTAVKYAAPLSSSSATAPAPSSSYRVVVENSYAASAQQVERDAYVRPSDGQVQVGSYRDANAAQQRIEQLRRQGIPARIE